MKNYFYKLLMRYISIYARPEDSIVEINPPSDLMNRISIEEVSPNFSAALQINGRDIDSNDDLDALKNNCPDFILMNGNVHYEEDIQGLLAKIKVAMSHEARLIITYYSGLWRPIIQLASVLKLRDKLAEENWVSNEDIRNLCYLADIEIIQHESRVLIPIWIPLISNIINRYIAPLPFFRSLALINFVMARVRLKPENAKKQSVSVVVAARNEEGNIQNIIDRLPKMGPDDELIFVEGGSSDNTWQKILEKQKEYKGLQNIIALQQDGIGKGDAVRKGFANANKEILMILDADLTVPPEDLPRFYEAIIQDKGEFINGSRLIYPMDKNAMQFLNMIGNKFFAIAFSFILGQRVKDTLCGTKVISRENYSKLASHRKYFGEFDPFGDFDLLFGAARLGLSITEIPVHYRERVYGDTNIQRWRHGLLLLRMTIFGARKFRFI